MGEEQIGLVYLQRRIGAWNVPILEFLNPAQLSLTTDVVGFIVNSIVDGARGRERQQKWKVQVASKVKENRGSASWDPNKEYAISVGLSFYPTSHGGRFDIENYLKPIFDATAAGLFCHAETKLQDIDYWNYDDSNFNNLLIHRLPDAVTFDSEGIALCISVK